MNELEEVLERCKDRAKYLGELYSVHSATDSEWKRSVAGDIEALYDMIAIVAMAVKSIKGSN